MMDNETLKSLSMSEGFQKNIIMIDNVGNLSLNIINLVKHKKEQLLKQIKDIKDDIN